MSIHCVYTIVFIYYSFSQFTYFLGWLFATYGIDTEELHSGIVPKPKLLYWASLVQSTDSLKIHLGFGFIQCKGRKKYS